MTKRKHVALRRSRHALKGHGGFRRRVFCLNLCAGQIAFSIVPNLYRFFYCNLGHYTSCQAFALESSFPVPMASLNALHSPSLIRVSS